jgi:hypothetical protein
MRIVNARNSLQIIAGNAVGSDVPQARELQFTEWELFRKLLDWEMGLLTVPDTELLFQTLLTKGLVWHCSGPMRRTASLMIREGRIHD